MVVPHVGGRWALFSLAYATKKQKAATLGALLDEIRGQLTQTVDSAILEEVLDEPEEQGAGNNRSSRMGRVYDDKLSTSQMMWRALPFTDNS